MTPTPNLTQVLLREHCYYSVHSSETVITLFSSSGFIHCRDLPMRECGFSLKGESVPKIRVKRFGTHFGTRSERNVRLLLNLTVTV